MLVTYPLLVWRQRGTIGGWALGDWGPRGMGPRGLGFWRIAVPNDVLSIPDGLKLICLAKAGSSYLFLP